MTIIEAAEAILVESDNELSDWYDREAAAGNLA